MQNLCQNTRLRKIVRPFLAFNAFLCPSKFKYAKTATYAHFEETKVKKFQMAQVCAPKHVLQIVSVYDLSNRAR